MMRTLCALLLSAATLAAQQPASTVQDTTPPRLAPAVAKFVKYNTSKNTLYLEHVRVIDGTGAEPIEDATVILLDGKIAAILTPNRMQANQGHATVWGCMDCPPALHLDLTGRTVFPGLVGMHDHMYYIARPNLDASGHWDSPLIVPEIDYNRSRIALHQWLQQTIQPTPPPPLAKKDSMNLLLTSSGISNKSIHDALVDLLGKPISESNALFIPTAIYPFPVGANEAYRAISGDARRPPLSQLGWESLGLLELTTLPSIDRKCWVPAIEQADALLAWGGDPVYLSYWMRQSGLTDLLPSLRHESVYVGVSAGSIAISATFAETYSNPRAGRGDPLTSEEIVFTTPHGELRRTLITAHGAGLVDFAIIPHLDHPEFPDASLAVAEQWAAKLPVPTYAIDDNTAIRVTNGTVEIISEGHWKLFP